MGKKVTISRASSGKTAKKQQAALSCSSSLMMKALRPRVYITDVANFKQLVQELTGNSNIPSPQPIANSAHLPCPPQLSRDTVTATTVVESSDNVLTSEETPIWDDFGGVLQIEDTLRKFFSGELPGLESSREQQHAQTYQQQQMETDALLTFGDVEGWLLDVDSLPSWESFVAPEDCPYNFVAGGIFEN